MPSDDRAQDLSLPKSMVARLAKGVLPANTQIHKDALLALHKSATVFVSYIASKYVDSRFYGAILLSCPRDFRAGFATLLAHLWLTREQLQRQRASQRQEDDIAARRHRRAERRRTGELPAEVGGRAEECVLPLPPLQTRVTLTGSCRVQRNAVRQAQQLSPQSQGGKGRRSRQDGRRRGRGCDRAYAGRRHRKRQRRGLARARRGRRRRATREEAQA